MSRNAMWRRSGKLSLGCQTFVHHDPRNFQHDRFRQFFHADGEPLNLKKAEGMRVLGKWTRSLRAMVVSTRPRKLPLSDVQREDFSRNRIGIGLSNSVRPRATLDRSADCT